MGAPADTPWTGRIPPGSRWWRLPRAATAAAAGWRLAAATAAGMAAAAAGTVGLGWAGWAGWAAAAARGRHKYPRQS